MAAASSAGLSALPGDFLAADFSIEDCALDAGSGAAAGVVPMGAPDVALPAATAAGTTGPGAGFGGSLAGRDAAVVGFAAAAGGCPAGGGAAPGLETATAG